MVALLLGPLGRGRVLVVTDCGVGTCFHKCANSVHPVGASGVDERGIPQLVSDI